MGITSTMFTSIFVAALFTCVDGSSVTWYSFTTSTSLSENYDSSYTLDSTLYASCYLTWEDCWFNAFGIKLFCSDESETRQCSCSLGNTYSGLFQFSGSTSSYTLTKQSCSNTNCGDYPSASACSNANGCANAGTHSLTVTCSASNSETSVSASQTHTVTFTSESPTFSITNLDGSANAYRTQAANTVIFSTTTTAGLTVKEWVESSSVSNSWLLSTSRLFRLNTGNGQVYINSNPSLEYSWTYSMTVCAYSRRQGDCGVLTISFSGCFQRPTCNDQSSTEADTFTVGNTLYTMVVPAPTDHFTAISSTFTGLSYAFVSTTLSVASLHSTTGVITTTGNLTVFPSYPDKVYTMVVRVSNTDSCTYTSDCTMTLTATFTNWPIDILSLSTSVTIHEDDDARRVIHTIIIYDYNHPDEDNVTCQVTANSDPTHFDLQSDGSVNSSYEYNSWRIYKTNCQNAGCGWLCTTGIGCFNHNLTQQYTFSVLCSDAYGSTDTGTLTINIQQNAAPVWSNLPNTITVNTDAVADLDVIYSFYYSDYENEDLAYNYTISPAQPTPTLFSFDGSGNFHSNPANVTALIYQWPLGNETYTLYVCGTERRNTICDTLTIQRREFCGPTPTCDNAANTVTDQFASGGTLFTINAPAPATGSYASLSYAIFADVNLFSVNPTSGVVTSTATLPITSPPAATSYSITANVYDTTACAYAVCHLSLSVTFTNFDISITNMASVTTNLHEDTTTENTLHTIATSDANAGDEANCTLNEAGSTPANNGKFIVRETAADSKVWIILNKEAPGFDYDVTTSYTIAVTCHDIYGSSDSATMTVTIDENQEPVLTNLPASINVDPITTLNGTQIYTMTHTDAENDAMTYYCNVTDSEVPLECATDGVASMRRDVAVPAEVGKVYAITMCITDSVHTHTKCGVLSVTITSSKTNPVISNLPATVNFDESISVGTVLFTLAVTDPDANDVHTYTLENVYPEDTRSMFTFVSTSGVLMLASALNYETQTTYNFTFSVTDTYLPGLAYKNLYLVVNDINEAPSLTLYTTTLSTTESNTGHVIGTILYECSDVDAGQTMTLSITSGTYMSYFTLTAGQLSFAQNWDFESVGLPTATVIVLTCSDGVSLTDSGSFTIYITPVNEFPPVPSITEIELTIYSTQTIQHTLFTVTATDSDYNDDGQFAFSIPGSGDGSQYFSVSASGGVYLTDYITWTYNYTFKFTVEVSDNETYPMAASVNVTINYEAPEIITVNERPDKCFTCTSQGVIVTITLCFGCFLILVFFVHACVRTQMWRVCQSEVIKTYDDAIRSRAKRTARHKRNKDFEDMLAVDRADDSISDSDSSDDNKNTSRNMGYRLGRHTMNQAMPRTNPPAPFQYNRSSLPNMITDLPEPATYNRSAISGSAIPEPKVKPDPRKPPSIAPQENFAFTKLSAFDKPVTRINKQKTPPQELAVSPDPGKLYSVPAAPAGFGRFLGTNPMFNKKPNNVEGIPVSYQGNNNPPNSRRNRHTGDYGSTSGNASTSF